MARHSGNNDSGGTGSGKPRVLFMHGLESGPRGSKARCLSRSFEVTCEDMLVGWGKSNSPLLHVVGQPSLWLVLWALVSTTALVWVSTTTWFWFLVFGGTALGVAGLVVRYRVVPVALADCVDTCLMMQRSALRDADVVVGSSFGGAVALAAACSGVWRGPTVLLAPAVAPLCNAEVQRRHGFNLHLPLSRFAAGPITLVHGSADETVAVEGSRTLATLNKGITPGFVYSEVDDQHRLASLLPEGRLTDLVQSVLQRAQRVE
eukprot:m.63814 g.63814  ORF g.63814 m.63814 type:complete len:262 (+) comp13506_c0_seq1:139-924(+)